MSFFNIHSLNVFLSSVYLKRIIAALEKLNDAIFACFLQNDYPKLRYLYERRIHVAKNKFQHLMDKLQKVIQRREEAAVKHPAKAQFYAARFCHLQQLYAVMLSYAQLRYRVSDPDEFSLCYAELVSLRQAQKIIFVNLMKLKPNATNIINTESLIDRIFRLEDVYQIGLCAAVKEPLSFLIFITDLNYFVDVIVSINSIKDDCQ